MGRRRWLATLLAALGLGGGWWWWRDMPPDDDRPPVASSTTMATSTTSSSTTSTLPPVLPPSRSPHPWPVVQGTPQRTGLATGIGPTGNHVRWSYALQAWGSPPLVRDDGTVLVGDDVGAIHALGPDGALRWTRALALPDRPDGYGQAELDDLAADGHYFAPHLTVGGALGADGTLYLPTTFHPRRDDPRAAAWYALRRDLLGLHALAPDGRLRWFLATGEEAAGSPLVLPDGRVLYRTTVALRAVTPTGRVAWTVALPAETRWSTPALSNDGTTIYVVAGTLLALRTDGTERWRLAVPVEGPAAHPTVGPDDAVYLGGAGDAWAVEPDGRLRWRRALGWIEGSPALMPDGGVAVATAAEVLGASRLHVLDATTGADRWMFTFPERGVDQALAVDADGTVYAATDSGWLYALRRGQVAWMLELGRAVVPGLGTLAAEADAAAALVDGTLYVAESGGPRLPDRPFRLHAVGTEAGPR